MEASLTGNFPLPSSRSDDPAQGRPVRLKPLGRIVFDLEKALQARSTTKGQLSLLESFDLRFGKRLDYRLWRGIKIRFSRAGIRRELYGTTFIDLEPDASLRVKGLAAALSQRAGRGPAKRLQAWGLLGLLAAEGLVLPDHRFEGLIDGSIDETLRLLDEMDELPLMAELPWGCFLAGTIARAKLVSHVLRTLTREGKSPDKAILAALYRSFRWTCATLNMLNPAGEPTGGFPLRGFEDEEAKGLRLTPIDTVTHGLRALAWALNRFAFYAQLWLPEEQHPNLAWDIFRTASGAWRILRWQRVMLEKFFPGNAERGAEARYFSEMQALSYAAKAAALAGETFRSAGLHWVFQTHYAHKVPINPKSEIPLRLEDWQFSAARQVGIEPDPLFEQAGWKSPAPVARKPSSLEASVPIPQPKRRKRPERLSVVQQRFWNHRNAHPDLWRPVAPHISLSQERFGSRFKISNCLAALGEKIEKRKVNGEKLHDHEVEVAGRLFQIFLDNDFLRSAMNMLFCLDEIDVPNHLLPAARRVSEAIRINRVAVSSKFMNEFIERILGAWEKCSDAPMSAADRVMLHELVLGRYSAIYSSVSAVAYRELLRPRLTPGERPNYLAILNAKTDAFIAARPQPGVSDLAEFSRQVGSTDLGRPLIVSLVALENGTSILSFGERTRLSAYFTRRLRLGPAAQRMLARRDYWFRTADDLCPPRDQVYWPPEFLRLRRRLVALARSNGARWLMLTVDPELACVPWQHLMSFAATDDENWLVTLCPSLGWGPICAAFRRDDTPHLPMRLICNSEDAAVNEARRRVGRTLEPDAQLFDIGIVLGHGALPSAQGAPSIMIGSRALGLEDLCRLNRHEVAVVHSCWTASGTNPRLWGDGMLVSHVLGRNCRAVTAPVGAVAPEAIEALQHAFTRPGMASLGARYLEAIDACPNVSLYNLYGLGSIEPRLGLYGQRPKTERPPDSQVEPRSLLVAS
jgi:hypothetical protein